MYTAAWLARAYRFNPLYRQHDFGQHVTVALFELADYASRDIRMYNRCYRVHPSVRRVRVNGGTSVAASGDGTLEVTADVDVVAAKGREQRLPHPVRPGHSHHTCRSGGLPGGPVIGRRPATTWPPGSARRGPLT